LKAFDIDRLHCWRLSFIDYMPYSQERNFGGADCSQPRRIGQQVRAMDDLEIRVG
jgi:hypothetical protein